MHGGRADGVRSEEETLEVHQPLLPSLFNEVKRLQEYYDMIMGAFIGRIEFREVGKAAIGNLAQRLLIHCSD